MEEEGSTGLENEENYVPVLDQPPASHPGKTPFQGLHFLIKSNKWIGLYVLSGPFQY